MAKGRSDDVNTRQLALYQLFLQYLRSKLNGIVLFLACMATFFAVCLLYQLENLQKLLYAFFLWAFIGLCHGAFQFGKYVRRASALDAACRNVENMQAFLPVPDGALETQYRHMIDMLLEERRQLLSHVNYKDMDMSDYYTMWAHQIKVPIAAMGLLLQNAESRAEATDAEPAAMPLTETELEDPSENEGHAPISRLLSEELFRIEQYVDMVLYYQRLDSITSDFLFKSYELRDIVHQAVKKHAMLFISKRLSLHMGDLSRMVITDEKWLQFVIGQILSNALKYTARGGIAIRLERDAERIQLCIEDTGIGIRPEDLPRIFERGFTGYNGRLDKKSTGIGLYLCKKILDKLSHTIEVTSEPGKGTRVAIGFILTKM